MRIYNKFKPKEVDKDTVHVLIKAGFYAPYGFNPPQPWHIVAIVSDRRKEITDKLGIYAPVVILPFVVRGIMLPNHLTNIGSGSAIAVNIAYQAESMGLGVYIEPKVSDELSSLCFSISGLSESRYDLSFVILVGYPDGNPIDRGGKLDYVIRR